MTLFNDSGWRREECGECVFERRLWGFSMYRQDVHSSSCLCLVVLNGKKKTIEWRWKWFHIRKHYHNRCIIYISHLNPIAFLPSLPRCKARYQFKTRKIEWKINFAWVCEHVENKIKDFHQISTELNLTISILYQTPIKIEKRANKSSIEREDSDEPDRNSTEENDFLHLNGYQFCVFLCTARINGENVST